MVETIEFTIGSTRTTALVARPKNPGPHPGVIVSFHHQGLDGPTADDVDLLAAEGFGEALSRFGIPHDFHRYDGADHAFTNYTHRYDE